MVHKKINVELTDKCVDMMVDLNRKRGAQNKKAVASIASSAQESSKAYLIRMARSQLWPKKGSCVTP